MYTIKARLVDGSEIRRTTKATRVEALLLEIIDTQAMRPNLEVWGSQHRFLIGSGVSFCVLVLMQRYMESLRDSMLRPRPLCNSLKGLNRLVVDT